MRKQSKSLLSMILTAAMVVSLGAGVTGEKSKAADATKIAPEFTAYLVQNNSKIFNGTEQVLLNRLMMLTNLQQARQKRLVVDL